MIKVIPRYIINFVVLVLVQVLILNNIQLGGFINPYVYILFILILPFETPKWLLLVLGFLLGFAIDSFTNTLGMHSSACVFMAFLRPFVLKMISPRDGYESETLPMVKFYGLGWFLRYAVILVFTHHLFLFYAEVFRFSDFFLTFFRVILSSIFSLLIIFISQYFYRSSTRRK
ncbi:MAG: rod shape-determining protein MreD [Bacteroidetes bacterium GWF2_33_16]|nr:MAG: rod shape-determining protein MreD [Bacteroidetes bacterium GWE2_32_14]OFY05246.1 MAG: rod shape-determining protein MreD [Bacteroidetes bacterium GWF2_33_16]